MPLNFPNSPSANDTYAYAGKSWTYNGNAWVLTSTTLSTSNVSEGSNLYYTSARVAPIFDQANTATTYATSAFDEANSRVQTVAGVTDTTITNAQIVAAITDSSPEFQDVVIQGNLTVTGNLTYLNVEALEVDDNMIYLNANSTIANPDLGWAGNYNDGTYRHAGVFRDATDGVFKFFDQYEPEPDTTAFIDTSNTTFHLANVQATTFIGNVTGTVSSLSNHDTDDLSEGSSNQYYTDARVYSNVTQIGYTSNAYVNTRLDTKANVADLTTANVSEVTNLYFSNVRAIEAVELAVTKLNVTNNSSTAYRFDQYGATTDNPSLHINAGETLAFDLVVTGHPFVIRDSSGGSNVSTGLIHVSDNGTITTGSNAQGKETGILYWKVPWDLKGASYVYQCTIHSGMVGDIVINDPSITATVAADLTTANVSEVTNLYFTNTRAVYALTAGNDISIDSNGLITSTSTGGVSSVNSETGDVVLVTANISEDTNLYFTNTRAVAALTGGNNIIIDANGLITSTSTGGGVSSADLTTANVVEVTNLYFTNTRAISALTPGENIEIASNGRITGTVTGGGGGGGNITVTYNTTPPASGNTIGDLWVDSSTGVQYFYIADSDSAQWVELSNPGLTGDAGTQDLGIRPTANLAIQTANVAFDQANAAFTAANTAASTGKAIAMAIVFG